MRYRLSDQIWLNAATQIKGPDKQHKLHGLVRFLAKQAAEADFAEEASSDRPDETRSGDNHLKKDL